MDENGRKTVYKVVDQDHGDERCIDGYILTDGEEEFCRSLRTLAQSETGEDDKKGIFTCVTFDDKCSCGMANPKPRMKRSIDSDLLSEGYLKRVKRSGDSNRIVTGGGGGETLSHAYPWMASLWIWGQRHNCGGSLVSNFHVLTAGHCIEVADGTPVEPAGIRVVLGAHDLDKRPFLESQKHQVRQAVVHPQYTNYGGITPRYDFALLLLKHRVIYTEHIRPICLPQMPPLEWGGGDVLTATGWGATKQDNTSPPSKLQGELQTNLREDFTITEKAPTLGPSPG